MKVTYREIIYTSIPLILSTSGQAIMQFVDAMFMSWYSPIALAANGSAGAIAFSSSSLMLGTVSYTSALTANYIGARMDRKVGPAIWQAIHLSIFFAIAAFIASFWSTRLFLSCKHEPELAKAEGIYLQILLLGTLFNLGQAAMAGFFSGRKDNVRLMLATIIGQVANIAGDYVLIFGKCGFPEMGIAGAALATTLSSALSFAILAWMMLSPSHRAIYHTWRGRKIDWGIMLHLLKFGVPGGLQIMVDTVMWCVFLVILGNYGEVALGSSNVVFKINSLALMPTLGIARAASAFIGQSHGRKEHKITLDGMKKSAILCSSWMLAITTTFIFIPDVYLNLFYKKDFLQYDALMHTSRILLRFVSAYCVMDSFNVSLCSSLQTVGDSKWVSYIQCAFAATSTVLLLVAGHLHASIYTIWTFVTVYIMVLPFFWYNRIKQGKWKNIVVAK